MNGVGKAVLNVSKAKDYVLAGKALLSVEDLVSGEWETFKVEQKINKNDNGGEISREPLWFVKMLTGPDNVGHYSYLCYIKLDTAGLPVVCASKKSPSTERANAAIACLKKIFDALNNGNAPYKLRLWHNGYCGRCGKLLTVPGSVESGLGPICAGKQGQTPEPAPEELISPCGHPACNGEGLLTFENGNTKPCPICKPVAQPEPVKVKESKTCKYCKNSGLEWAEKSGGGWKLIDAQGNDHVCAEKPSAPKKSAAPAAQPKLPFKKKAQPASKQDGIVCKDCGKTAFWQKSQKTGAYYLTNSPYSRTDFHSKTCTGK